MKLLCVLFTAACTVRVVVMLMPRSITRLRLMDVIDFILVMMPVTHFVFSSE
jgi:hypothetical protein